MEGIEKQFVVTKEEMMQYDQNTSLKTGLCQSVLIERAAVETAKYLMENERAYLNSMLILIGYGNNGADAVAVGRILIEYGYSPSFYFLNSDESRISEALSLQKKILMAYQPDIVKEIKKSYAIYLDGIFGCGLNREITGDAGKLIEEINQKAGRKISLDIPSGIEATDGRKLGYAFLADATITFGFLKRGLFLLDGKNSSGIIALVKTGINVTSFYGTKPEMFTYYDSNRNQLKALSEHQLKELSEHQLKELSEHQLKELSEHQKFDMRRPADGNKGTFGKVTLITGSTETGGACILSCESALRSGCGMVRAVTARENGTALQARLPEAMTRFYDYTSDYEKIVREMEQWSDVIVMGCGTGTGDMQASLLKQVICHTTKPLILDADAITILSMRQEIAELLCDRQSCKESKRILIFTPHLKELSVLCKQNLQEVKEHLLDCCRQQSLLYNAIFVAKDAKTVVYQMGSGYYLNNSGNDCLATAGSGDVLTGLIGSVLAQMIKRKKESEAESDISFQAAVNAVYLHGKAGEIAALRTNRGYVIASDIIRAYTEIMK